jgi:hypothetical protein
MPAPGSDDFERHMVLGVVNGPKDIGALPSHIAARRLDTKQPRSTGVS